MKPFIALSALLALSACATQQQRCISSVTANQRNIAQLIAVTEANINRGYGVNVQRVPYTVYGRCYDSYSIRSYSCPETYYRTVTTPVTVDLDAEKRKLAQLKQRLPEEQKRAKAGVDQCLALYPE
ncbi:hypothetical protein OU789_11025 [Halocynthiibacter sp. C4]|uniref:hypothetical protein n=1 Tax=Halocynthiibacter sp. C4 TaxID=2992758 RepID=UPI00237BFA93|nr:hypothetical protein [Halocynthiibacter sp. C4]MDE0590459.1 hypothetical protein [Halocynthiibacter sp. C4]